MKQQFSFAYTVYDSAEELPAADKSLLEKAREATGDAYAPYSRFKVAAAARLSDGSLVTATNQENASYPVGICAERTLLSAVSALYTGRKIDTIAVSYAGGGNDNRPVSPCGLCRQTLVEYEERFLQPIRLVLGGQAGPVYVISSCADLLPLRFTAAHLNSAG